MAALAPSSKRFALKDAIAIESSSPNVYAANVHADHCYAQVAHGGLLVSIIQRAVRQHFASTLRRCAQPDLLNLQLVFLRPTSAGPVTVKVDEAKLGPLASTVHVQLLQADKLRVAGYATNTNTAQSLQRGRSFATNWALEPPPPPASIPAMEADADPNWVGWTLPWRPASPVVAATHAKFFVPRSGPCHASIADMWVTPLGAASERFTTDMLGSVADHWTCMVENYRSDSPWEGRRFAKLAEQYEGRTLPEEKVLGFEAWGYPTVSFDLEVKRNLPPEGVRWLFLRARAKGIEGGRFDVEVTVSDEGGRLVAISHQVALILHGLRTPEERARSKVGLSSL